MYIMAEAVNHSYVIAGRQTCVLVAHDWGGVVAWEFVLQHHKMVDRYIIMGAPYRPAFYEVVKTNPKQLLCSW